MRRNRVVREPGMFLSSLEECEKQCAADENCVGFSMTDDDFQFPSRCIIHSQDLTTLPMYHWRIFDDDAERTSTTIVYGSNDEGVGCYSKIYGINFDINCSFVKIRFVIESARHPRAIVQWFGWIVTEVLSKNISKLNSKIDF